MLETIITELAPAVLSIVAVLISMLKGKAKNFKTDEEIENIAEAKKQKIVAKLNKKNKIKPIENNESDLKDGQTIYRWPKFEEKELSKFQKELLEKMEKMQTPAKPNWQQAFGVKTEEETETQGE